MSRTKKGSKEMGYEYWSARPGNKGGGIPGKAAKRATHKAERRLTGRALEWDDPSRD